MSGQAYELHLTSDAGSSPVVAAAVHAGHDLGPLAAAHARLAEAERLREEDPYTDEWARSFDSWVVVRRSRFEADLNRSLGDCVYAGPQHSWGLDVWGGAPPDGLVEASRALHRSFRDDVRRILETLAEREGGFVLLDLHSYNHRRGGSDAPPDDPDENPDVNVGTGSLHRMWRPVVERFMADLRAAEVPLDVRENAKFRGGDFPTWVNRESAGRGCALAIEVKKTFMDEWSGELYRERFEALGEALRSTVPGLEERLRAVLAEERP